jgi:hypothetical protein
MPDDAVDIGVFHQAESAPPAPWQIVSFDKNIPQTRYQIIRWDDVYAIEAKANGSMALLARPLSIDLTNTPVLCWRWRIDEPVSSADMTRKSGDDYAARVYVAFELPDEAINWQTRLKLGIARTLYGELVPDAALNYVWDNRHPIGTVLPNAFTDRTMMRVLQSGNQNAGDWINERRDVLADAEHAFGKLGFKARLIAVASDTDNTGEKAHAGFADLHFVGSDKPCEFATEERQD